MKQKPILKLVGTNGNAFAVLGKATAALIKAGYSPEEVKEYTKQAMAGDYNHLLVVTMEWLEVE